MVFPVLFIALLALLMLSLYTYQTVVVYHSASETAERTAFRWDNSARDPVSGIGPIGRYDGLYWRMADNGALQSLFGFVSDRGGDGGTEIAVGETAADEGGGSSLPERKLRAESSRVENPFQGTIRYEHGALEKRVQVKLRQPITIPPLETFLGHSEPASASAASIVDPVELIRNVDLIRYYAGKFKGGMDSDKRKQAQAILGDRQAMNHG